MSSDTIATIAITKIQFTTLPFAETSDSHFFSLSPAWTPSQRLQKTSEMESLLTKSTRPPSQRYNPY